MKLSDATLNNATSKKTYIAAAIATMGIVAVTAFTPPAQALGNFDNLELGTGLSSTNDGDTTSVGTRVLATDGLENLGAGLGATQMDEDGSMSSLGVQAESTDDLENLNVGANAVNVDEDGDGSSVGTNVTSTDGLDNLNVGADVMNHDGDDSTNFGVRFGFED